ncbi:MAG TPA: hypothetical protein VFV50_13060 [Bdellovibrionales bacterium]|nr:hypothetical protein [Bdellovibrionales bacterium]
MARYIYGFFMSVIFLAGAVWGISVTHARGNQTLLQDLVGILPPKTYQGETCSIDVKSEKKLGTRSFKVGITFADGEGQESFELDDSALGPQVLHYSHDAKKEHFLKVVVAPPAAPSEENQLKLTVIRSAGQVAAVAVQDKVCFLTNQ